MGRIKVRRAKVKACIIMEVLGRKLSPPAICGFQPSTLATLEMVVETVLPDYWPDRHQAQVLTQPEEVGATQAKRTLRKHRPKPSKTMDITHTEVLATNLASPMLPVDQQRQCLPKNLRHQDNLEY